MTRPSNADLLDTLAESVGRFLSIFRTTPEPKDFLVYESRKAPPSPTETPPMVAADEALQTPTPSPAGTREHAPVSPPIQRVAINQSVSSQELEVIRSRLGDTQLRLTALDEALNDLQNRVSGIYVPRPGFPLPSTGSGGIADVVIQPKGVSAETLTISKNTTLSVLDVSGTLSVTGDAAFDTNTLFVDAVSNRVGVGTRNLDVTFEVAGTASISGQLLVAGNIGIGTTTAPNQLTVIGSGSFTGRLDLSRSPTLAHTGTWPNFGNVTDATLYLNPASPVADGNILVYANGGSSKFVVDAEGDVFANNLVLTGSTTQGTTTIAGDLNVEGNVRLGDASTDRIRIVGTILPNTLTSNIFTIQASPSWSGGHYLRVLNSASVPIFTVASTSNAALAGNLTVSGTASSSFAGSLDVTKGLRAAQITGTGLTVNGNAAITGTLSAGATTLSSLTVTNLASFSNASASGAFESVAVKANTLSTSTGTLTINAFTLGGALAAGGNNILNVGQLTANVASIATNFEAVGYASIGGNVLTKGNLTASGTGSSSFAGSLDVTKGLRASNFTQVGSGVSYFNGNVGIGTTIASARVHVLGSAATTLRLESPTAGQATAARFLTTGGGSDWSVGTNINAGTGTFEIADNNFGSRLVINASGNVGIGTANVDAKLEVAGTASVSGTAYFGGNVGIGTTAPGLLGGSSRFLTLTSSGNNASLIELQMGTATAVVDSTLGEIDIYNGATRVAYMGGLGGGATDAGLLAFGTMATGGSLQERMRILSNGNVGIGTTNPSARLESSTSSSNQYAGIFRNNAAAGFSFGLAIEAGGNSSDAAFTVANRAGSTPFLWVRGDGNVGIGTTGPGGKLDVRDGNFVLTDADVAHGVTDLAATTLYSRMTANSGTAGGLLFDVFSDDADTPPFYLRSVFGSTDPTDTVAGIILETEKRSGTSITTLGASETVIKINNQNTNMLTILGSGNVGIGTSGPGHPLEVRRDQNAPTYSSVNNTTAGTASAAGFYALSSDAAGINMSALSASYTTAGALTADSGIIGTDGGLSGGLSVYVTAAAPIRFYTGGAASGNERVRIDSTGNVGIGTTGPTALTSLYSTATASFDVTSQGQTDKRFTIRSNYQGAGTSERLSILNGAGAELVSMASSGNVGIGTTSPAERLMVETAASLNIARFKTTSGSGGEFLIGAQNTPGTASVFLESNGATSSGISFRTRNASGIGDRMVIDKDGLVGIGTTSPGALTHFFKSDVAGVAPNGNATVALEKNGTGNYLEFIGGTTSQEHGLLWTDASGNPAQIYLDHVGDKLRFAASGSFSFETGNVGIGTTGPTSLFSVRQALGVTDTNGIVSVANLTANNSSNNMIVKISSNDGAAATNPQFISFFRGNFAAQVGQIRQNGDATAYDTTSDLRRKENVRETVLGLDTLMRIRVRDFNFMSNPTVRLQGYIAQELFEIYPEAVHVGGDDPNTNPWAVDYGRLTPLIVRAVQEQQDQLASLSLRFDYWQQTQPTTMRVSLENGPINVGDRLATSSQAGVAMKMTVPGESIGIALEPLNTISSGSFAEILAIPKVGYWAPSASQAGAAAGGGSILASIGATPQGLLAEIAGTLSQWLLDQLASGSIQLVKAFEGVFDTVTAQFVKTERLESKTGLTTYDQLTGEAYCIQVRGGTTVSTLGACGGEQSPSTTPSVTPEGSATLSPTPSATPGPTATPTPESTPSPEPTPEGTPEPSLTPTPTP
jgi:hypothetical protein